jgi:hypothetical protein
MLRRPAFWLITVMILVMATVAVFVVMPEPGAGGVAHIVVTPPRLGAFVADPALANEMHAEALRHGIVARSHGEAKNVVDAVYQDATGHAAASGPQIMLFIGGNLSGSSANGFISSFTGQLIGAVTISPGSLRGEAACVPAAAGGLAECAWADNDTFGVIASPTLNAVDLASELRQIRPLVEHAVK